MTGYKLKSAIIHQILGFDKKNAGQIRKALANVLNKAEYSINSYLKANAINGELTKYGSLIVILSFVEGYSSTSELIEKVEE